MSSNKDEKHKMEKRSWVLPMMVLVAASFFVAAINYKQPAKAIDPAVLATLVKTDIKPGNGDEAIAGKRISVHYTGWLYEEAAANYRGLKFDSSFDRNQPLEFLLGDGQVILGWEHGMQGMKVGGKRILIIPAEMAYGKKGVSGVIPPNSQLVFEVELTAVR